jgi:drug/metabolite transporter (DMT)-like permease
MKNAVENKSLYERFTENGYAMMITSTVMFAFMALFVKLSTARESIPAFETVFYRSAINLVIILVFARLDHRDLMGTNKKLLIMRGILGFSALTTYFIAISMLNLADAVILSYTSTIFVSIFCVIFLKEKFSLPLAISIFFALVGATLVLKPSFQFFNAGGLIGLSSGIIAAAVYVSLRRLTTINSSTTIIFYFTAISTILSLPPTLYKYVHPSFKGWVYLILMGVFATLGQFAMTRGYKYLEAQRASLISTCNIIIASLLAYFILKESMDIYTILGGALIFISSIGVLLIKPLFFDRQPPKNF